MIQSYNSMANQKHPLKVVALLLMAVLLLVGGFAAGNLYSDKSRQKIAKSGSEVGHKFVELVTAGKYEEAYTLTGGHFKESGLSDKDLKKQLGTLKSDNASFESESIVSEIGVYDVLTYTALMENMPKTEEGKTSALFTVSIINEGKGWKVDNVDVR